MAQRHEIDRCNTSPGDPVPGADLGDGTLADGCHAWVIGNSWASAFAVDGTADELGRFATRLSDLLHRALLPGNQNRAPTTGSA